MHGRGSISVWYSCYRTGMSLRLIRWRISFRQRSTRGSEQRKTMRIDKSNLPTNRNLLASERNVFGFLLSRTEVVVTRIWVELELSAILAFRACESKWCNTAWKGTAEQNVAASFLSYFYSSLLVYVHWRKQPQERNRTKNEEFRLRMTRE